MEKYEEGIRRAAAHSIKDLNLGSKSFAPESRNDHHLHRHNQVQIFIPIFKFYQRFSDNKFSTETNFSNRGIIIFYIFLYVHFIWFI